MVAGQRGGILIDPRQPPTKDNVWMCGRPIERGAAFENPIGATGRARREVLEEVLEHRLFKAAAWMRSR
jgi:hypothetical protein